MKAVRKLVVLISLLAVGCGTSKKLIYKDDWEGRYTLIEYNCCGDTATKVKMEIVRTGIDKYEWKLFLSEGQSDIIAGEALYKKNKLKFYPGDPEMASKYFAEAVSMRSPVFWMEYQTQRSYYTRWYTDLKNYRRGKMLFAGIDFHFKRAGDR